MKLSRFSIFVLALLLALDLAACGAKQTRPVGITEESRFDDGSRRQLPPSSQPVVGHMIGNVAERTIGPFLARKTDGATSVAAWVTPAEATVRRVLAIPLSGVGEPRGGSKVIANVGIDTTMLVVKPVRGPNPGFALAWTTLTDRGEALWAVVLGDDASPRGKPIELARTTDDVVWVDVVPTELGAVFVWAEETRGGDANVLATSIDSEGRPHGVPSRVANGVAGWHAIEIPGGVGVSTVSAGAASSPLKPGKAGAASAPAASASAAPAAPAPAPPTPAAPAAPAQAPGSAGAKGGGVLAFHRLDASGRASTPPTIVVGKPVVSGDVEVARAGTRFLFAWTDRSQEEPAIFGATLADDGKTEGPRKVVDGRGGAALLGLVAGPGGSGALLWESPARHGPADTRKVHLARISSAFALEGKPMRLETIGRAVPEIVATPDGYAVLAPVKDCDPGSPRCPDAGVVAAIVRTNDRAVPVQRETFGFGTDPASMGWSLTCNATDCLALAASGTTPARVRAAEVRPRVNLAAPPDQAPPPKDGPRVEEVLAVVTGESIVDMAGAKIGDATVIAMLGTKAEAASPKAKAGEDPKHTPLVLTTRVVDANGVVGPPTVLTNRALAVGGVAIAPAEKSDDGGAVAWVARDSGDLEVHVTKIDRKGKKTNDLQLTTMKGDASDVAIVWAGGGWIVAWVDARDGNGEVYATKVGADLSRNAGERITNAPGDASDLVAAVRGDDVWLAWADPRESPRDGMADIYVAAVRAKDAKRSVEEQRLLATASHSRTPQLALTPSSVHVAWIEEAPMGTETPGASGYGAMWATLGADGKITRRPTRLTLAGEGAATSVALERAPNVDGVRAVVARSNLDAISLDAMSLATAETAASPLLTLDGPPSLDVALFLDGGMLYFNDDGPTPADKRARRARISWNR
ncbi:MAG: hypothetical protein JST00_20490 [Deltaproteobacteria bacterium]|nr:hypothetical protein [Deltaproteobacteria bacterium]